MAIKRNYIITTAKCCFISFLAGLSYYAHSAFATPKSLPALMLWTWESPQNLNTINPHSTGIALLILTIDFRLTKFTYYPRQQPLYAPPNAYKMAVIHITTPPKDTVLNEGLANLWALKNKKCLPSWPLPRTTDRF